MSGTLKARQIGVIGAGAWGTALAVVAAHNADRVVLWARDRAVADDINRRRENSHRLAGITLDARIVATADGSALAGIEPLLLAMPAQSLRPVMGELRPHIAAGARAVIAAKGIERDSSRFMTEVLADVCPDAAPLVLSGPSFAADVARGLPTAVTLAAQTLDIARPVAEMLSTPSFRPYVSDDLVGVQLGGAVKNVMAIACGIVAGRGLGESAGAALIARSFAELGRLGRVLGARPETLMGLSGLGDLVLTASSRQSRNYALGLALGQGMPLEVALRSGRGISEGATTAAAAGQLAARHGIELPVSAAVLDVLEGRAGIDEVILRLMQRPLRAED